MRLMRMPSPTRRKTAPRGTRLLGIAIVVLATVLVATPGLAADYPRVLQVDASRSPEISVTVVVPPPLSGATLPASAFAAREGGHAHAVTRAVQLPLTDLRLILMLDTAVQPDDLAAEQGAARELLVRPHSSSSPHVLRRRAGRWR